MVIAIVTALLLSATEPTPARRAWTACVDRTTTNTDWGQCGNAYVSEADAALNATWRKLMATTGGKTRSDLVAEERAWLSYRKIACAFYANGDWGREGQVLHGPACTADVIENRTADLRRYLEFMTAK